MASAKRIGFSWGEEKITLVEFEKNTPLQIITSRLDSKTSNSSPFSSNFTEEIHATTIFQKVLVDYHITGGTFYISLPMKEVILRSFVIPFVKPEEVQDAVKFEARKYLPIDIQELNFVFYKTAFSDNKSKRLQVVFFAVRKEIMERYERIFKQLNAEITHCEPCVVSLAKMLLFKKEIKPTDHIAFLILEKNLGRICFIDQGIPQFVREFAMTALSSSEEVQDSIEALNAKILNEVGNSFDFYARQFSGERIEQMLISTETVSQDLFNAFETELKLKIRRVSPVVTVGGSGESNDMDAIYSMGACVDPAIESLAGLNFVKDTGAKSKFSIDIADLVNVYKEIILVFVVCVALLIAVNVLFTAQLKVVQQQYNQVAFKEGAFLNAPLVSIQTDTAQNSDKLTAYKNIRTKSDMALILFKVASHLPKGSMLKSLTITYPPQGNLGNSLIDIDMKGIVEGEDANAELAVVNQIFVDFKNDKELATLVKTVNLVSLNSNGSGDKPVAEFNIHCS